MIWQVVHILVSAVLAIVAILALFAQNSVFARLVFGILTLLGLCSTLIGVASYVVFRKSR